MNINFRALIAQIRSALGMKPNARPTGWFGDSARPHSFRPEVEELEGRVTPSTTTPQALQVYHTLTVVADQIATDVEGAAQAALTNAQTLQQGIGPAFLQTLTNQITTDLAPLSNINFGGTPAGGLFGATSSAAFGQKAADFIKNCVNIKVFARCATQAAADGASISSNLCSPAQLADLSGAIVYGTVCANTCDEIYTCEIAPCVQQFCSDIYDGDPCVLQNEPLEIQNCVSQGDLLAPAVLQSGEQAIQQFCTDPGSVSSSQTPTLQFDRADGSTASSTTFTLSATGAVESSTSTLFDTTGAVETSNVQTNYTANGLVSGQDATLYNAGGSVASSYNSLNLSDGFSATVQTVFNPNTLVANQNLTVYSADGSVDVSASTTNVEGADHTLATTSGVVTVGAGTLSDTFTLTNTESAAGTLSSSATTTNGPNGSLEAGDALFDATSLGVTFLASLDYKNGVQTDSIVVDGNGNIVSSTTNSGSTGGNSGGGDTGGDNGAPGDNGGGDTGGGNTGGDSGGGDPGGDTGGGNTSGDTGGGDTGGDTGGGDTGGDDTGGDSGDSSGGDDSGGDDSGGDDSGGDDSGGDDFSSDALVRARPMVVAMIAPAPAMIAASVDANAAAPSGEPFAGIVGSFFDTDPNPADYSAIITWSDGAGSAGIVSAAGSGEFNILGSHPSTSAGVEPTFLAITNVVTGDQGLAANPALLVDTTPPTPGTVSVNTGLGGNFQASATTIAANWSGFTDPAGIASYQWAIGTSPGGADVQAFTNVGSATNATNSSLTLKSGTTYYVSVKATDNADNVSSVVSSSGVTVDTTPPTSAVAPLPAGSAPAFTVAWSGADNVGGSGLATFSIYVSDNGGAYQPFLLGTTRLSATFNGIYGHTYAFYSTAVDNVGNIQAAPAAPQATTTVDLGPSGTIAASTGYDTPTFAWNAVAGADHYYLYAVDNNTGGLVSNNPNVKGTSFTLPSTQALTPGHGFTWYVRAYSASGMALDAFIGQTFTLAPLAAPTGLTPSGSVAAAAGYDRPTFSWNASAGANHYYLVVVDNNTGAAPIVVPNFSGVSYSATAAQTLTPGHSFTVYVYAMSTNSQAYALAAQKFSLASLAAPTGLTPSGSQSAASGYDRPTFSWNASPGANHYYLVIVDNNTGAAPIVVPNVTGTSYVATTAQALTPGHSFTIYVYAMSTNGQANTVATQTFTLAALAAPTGLTPSGFESAATGYDRPTFSWNASVGANHYYLVVVDNITGAAPIVVANVSGASYSATAAQALTPGHSFTTYVYAMSTNNKAYALAAKTFTLAPLAAPTPMYPTGPIAASPASFAWSAAPGADHYYLYVVDDTTGAAVITQANLRADSFSLNMPLTQGHKYTWWVAAVSSNELFGIWSSSQVFTIA